MIHEAAGLGVEMMVFPELALSPYFAATIRPEVRSFAEPAFPTEETQPIVDAVKITGILTVLPHAEIDGEVLYNSSVILGSDGQILGRYRKSHIPGTVEPAENATFSILEKRYFAPGDLGFPVYPSPAGSLGVGICYDRRFPELYRCYGLKGAGVIACCYNTPVVESWGSTIESSQEDQELAVRGGAISNGIPVIAAGKAGVELGTRYSGGSCVVDFKGRILAKAKTDGDELVVATLDLQAAAALRERMDLATNRRPEIYGVLTTLERPAEMSASVTS
jgi:predicted amidohydrolase